MQRPAQPDSPQGANARRRAGLCLIEVMLAVTITAILLLTVAAAFDASFANYSQNQQMADALQGSRVLMHRIMTQARRSTYLQVSSAGHRIQIETPDEAYQYIYVYVPASRQVILSRMHLATLAVEDLGCADNVTAFQVPSAQWVENPARLTLSMTVRVGANASSLTSSAVPRQTLSF